jgi:hypothetical protein
MNREVSLAAEIKAMLSEQHAAHGPNVATATVLAVLADVLHDMPIPRNPAAEGWGYCIRVVQNAIDALQSDRAIIDLQERIRQLEHGCS